MKTYTKNITIFLAMALLIQSSIMPAAQAAPEKQTRLQQLKKQVAYELVQFRSCVKGDGECTKARQRAYLAIGLLLTGLGAGGLTWYLAGNKKKVTFSDKPEVYEISKEGEGRKVPSNTSGTKKERSIEAQKRWESSEWPVQPGPITSKKIVENEGWVWPEDGDLPLTKDFGEKTNH